MPPDSGNNRAAPLPNKSNRVSFSRRLEHCLSCNPRTQYSLPQIDFPEGIADNARPMSWKE